ncbi:MAG: hypothetical protein ACTSWN_09375 [Promethearchaeota archaeon]
MSSTPASIINSSKNSRMLITETNKWLGNHPNLPRKTRDSVYFFKMQNIFKIIRDLDFKP